MKLVLSSDAKPRLKWTSDLHLRFLEAVNQLGGVHKATPKSLMRLMDVPGLTLYHLKSHLQKFRLGKSHPSQSQSQSQSQTSIDTKQEDYIEIQSSNRDLTQEIEITQGNDIPTNESFQIAQALQVQMEVQRKLHHHIEVQRRLQLRIEAQAKYLQSVLRKAQETLSGYNSSSSSSSSSMGIQLAKAELSRLVSMVNNGCQSSSISELTETQLSSLEEAERKQMTCSVESSLTSSQSSGPREDKQSKNETSGIKFSKTALIELPLMHINPQTDQAEKDIINTTHGLEQPPVKRSKTTNKLRIFDLNRQYQNDFESNSKAIDLNLYGN